MHCAPTNTVRTGGRERERERGGHELEHVFIHPKAPQRGWNRAKRFQTFFQMSSNVSTPSATFFRHLSISPVATERGETVQGEGESLDKQRTVWRIGTAGQLTL